MIHLNTIFCQFLCFSQVLHNMSMWTAKVKSLTYDQAKKDAAKAQKDIKMVNNSLILNMYMYVQFCVGSRDGAVVRALSPTNVSRVRFLDPASYVG